MSTVIGAMLPPMTGLPTRSALLEETRLFSVYRSAGAVVFWVITEADRSSTMVLLPEDY
jgi:hypothetical protein